jgi:hypothetical protein
MRHQRCEVLGVACARLLPSRVAKPLDEPQKWSRVMVGNRAVGDRIVPVWAKTVLRNHDCAAVLVGTIEQACQTACNRDPRSAWKRDPLTGIGTGLSR